MSRAIHGNWPRVAFWPPIIRSVLLSPQISSTCFGQLECVQISPALRLTNQMPIKHKIIFTLHISQMKPTWVRFENSQMPAFIDDCYRFQGMNNLVELIDSNIAKRIRFTKNRFIYYIKINRHVLNEFGELTRLSRWSCYVSIASKINSIYALTLV